MKLLFLFLLNFCLFYRKINKLLKNFWMQKGIRGKTIRT